MENEAQDRRKRGYALRRAILDYGIVLLLAPKFGLTVALDDTLRYCLGGLFLLYGGFRVYRGSKKNYFN